MSKGRDHLHERKDLNRMEFAFLAVQQKGLCGNCKTTLTFLEPRSVRDEHLKALSMGGTNELKNRELWCLSCAVAKNKKEAPILAKAKRLSGETGQAKRRAERKAKGKRPLIQGRSEIQSRGFSKPPAGYSAWKRGTANVKQLDEL